MNHLTAHPVRRAAVGVLAGTLACTGAIVTAGASPANAVEGFAFERLSGDDRFETAAAIAADTFPTGASTAIIARSDDFADALTGNYLAGVLGAPVLLTRTGDLPAATAAALEALGVDDVVIVGGTNAVSPAVEATLREDYAVRRLAGTDRFLTAQAVAEDGAGVGTGVGSFDQLRTAVLGNGLDFPDVLAAGPLGYAEGFPITITRPGDLPDPTAAVLRDLDIEQVIVVGGDAVVSPAVRAEVEQITGNPVIELEGANRFLTANAIADFAYDELDFDATHVNLARSNDFADALAGGPHAGEERAPILLTTPTALSVPTRDYLASRSGTLEDGHILGGNAAVSSATQAAAEEAAQGEGSALSVTPDTSQTLTAVANPDSTTTDDRSYSVAGLTPGEEYRITLVKAENITTNAAGETVYAEDGTTGLAATGSPTADIKTVNGRPAENNTGDGTALTANPAATSPSAVFEAGAAGTATFVIDGDGAESVRPVVYRNGGPNNTAADGGTSPRLDLEDDGTAADEADTGGVTVFQPPPRQTAAATVRPELVRAAVLSTTAPDASNGAPVGTVVEYFFDEEITGTRAVVETGFHVYDEAGTQFTAVNDQSTIADSGTSIRVRFAAIDTAGEAASLRLATVDAAAVNDNEGDDNPIGDAPLGNATTSTRTLQAGVTQAPDLVSVGNFRPTPGDATTTTVEFTFDEAAFTVVPAGFALVTPSGALVECTAPATAAGGDPAAGAAADRTIDAACAEPAGTGTTTTDLTASNVARGIVRPGTVSDDDPDTTGTTVEGDGAANPLQATQTPDANTVGPDLVSAALQLAPATSETGEDTVVYTFDVAVTISNAAPGGLPLSDADGANGQLDFTAYREDGTEVTASNAVRSGSNANQVIATFADELLDTAVGASVRASAVTGQTGAASGQANQPDEVAMANSSTTTVGEPAGSTAGPDLTGVAVESDADGAPVVVYAFDEDLDVSLTPVVGGQQNVDAGRFFLVLADGTTLACTEGEVLTAEDADSEFVCTAYGTATAEQIRSAVVGTVDDAAVASADEDGTANPEGAELVTGTTGTARQ